MQRFKSLGSAKRYLNVHAAIYKPVAHQRHLINHLLFKKLRAGSFGRCKATASRT